MTILEHEHHLVPIEGRLLSPQEKIDLNLDTQKHFYINGRCNLPGCDYFTFQEIPVIKTRRGPRIYTGKKR
jgi:hypothetical protein